MAGASLRRSFALGVVLAALARPPSSLAYEVQPAPAENRGRLGLGLNYPGVGARYFFTDLFLLEARGQLDGGARTGGLRAAGYFAPLGPVLPFLGLEGDYVAFSGDQTRGSGYAGEAFAGGELFLTSRLSLQFDFGPAYLYLKDRDSKNTASGLEYVVNFGINVYFLGRGGGGGSDASYSEAEPERHSEAKPKKAKARARQDPELDQRYHDWNLY